MLKRVSIRLRLTLWNASVLALTLIAFAMAGWATLVVTLRVRGDAAVSETARAIAAAVKAERLEAHLRGEEPGPEVTRDALRELRAGDLDVFIVDEAARVLASSRRRARNNSGRGNARTSTSNTELRTSRAGTTPAVSPPVANTPGTTTKTGAAPAPDSIALPVPIRSMLRESVSGEEVPVRSILLDDGSHRAAVVRVPRGEDEEEPELVVAVMRSDDEDIALLTRVRTTLLFAIPLALLVSFIAGYVIARRSLAPIEAMAARAARISAATLDERLPVVNAHDELGQLARIINDLLGRVQDAFRQQRQFVADASHELRTPIAIVRGETDVTLQRQHRDEAEYREALSVIKDESVRLTRIVDDLFLLARADAGAPVGAREPLDLRDVALAALRSVRTIAEERGMKLEYLIDDETRADERGVIVLGDIPLLRRLLLNLLDNAIKYTPRGGRVALALNTTPATAILTVSDTGPGISPALRARVFDRFVRAAPGERPPEHDTDGSVTSSGAGLGLAIAYAIAQAHNGTLTLDDSAQGACFRVEIPRVPAFES